MAQLCGLAHKSRKKGVGRVVTTAVAKVSSHAPIRAQALHGRGWRGRHGSVVAGSHGLQALPALHWSTVLWRGECGWVGEVRSRAGNTGGVGVVSCYRRRMPAPAHRRERQIDDGNINCHLLARCPVQLSSEWCLRYSCPRIKSQACYRIGNAQHLLVEGSRSPSDGLQAWHSRVASRTDSASGSGAVETVYAVGVRDAPQAELRTVTVLAPGRKPAAPRRSDDVHGHSGGLAGWWRDSTCEVSETGAEQGRVLMGSSH